MGFGVWGFGFGVYSGSRVRKYPLPSESYSARRTLIFRIAFLLPRERRGEGQSSPLGASTNPRKALRGGIQKSTLKDVSGNVGDSRQRLTKIRNGSKNKDWIPTKGLLWTVDSSETLIAGDSRYQHGRHLQCKCLPTVGNP